MIVRTAIRPRAARPSVDVGVRFATKDGTVDDATRRTTNREAPDADCHDSADDQGLTFDLWQPAEGY